jgi:hypothetical protein
VRFTDVTVCTADQEGYLYITQDCPKLKLHGVHDWYALNGPSEEAPMLHCRGRLTVHWRANVR